MGKYHGNPLHNHFSVEFDPLIETLGYAKKDKATLRLERDFEKDKDFVLLLLRFSSASPPRETIGATRW